MAVQHSYKNFGIKGWEGDLAATSVTSVITRIDSADLAWLGGCPLPPLPLPCVSLPKLGAWSKRIAVPDFTKKKKKKRIVESRNLLYPA